MGQVKALAVGSVKSVKEASERWNISERWIQKLCEFTQVIEMGKIVVVLKKI